MFLHHQHCLKHLQTLMESEHAWKHRPCCLPAPTTILQAISTHLPYL